jgi:broad specificity phosphatase PhoE
MLYYSISDVKIQLAIFSNGDGKMIRLLLARHGETARNSEKRIQGRSDAGLSRRGIQQAAALAKELKGEELHALYCSDQKRAKQTAERIAALHKGLQIVREPRLREIDFGLWEGLTLEDVQARFPAELHAWQEGVNAAPPGGEPMAGVMQRTGDLLEALRARHTGQTVLLVAHAGVLQALICQAMEILPRRWWAFHLYTASLSELWLYEHGATLVSLNDLGALARAGIPPESVRGR